MSFYNPRFKLVVLPRVRKQFLGSLRLFLARKLVIAISVILELCFGSRDVIWNKIISERDSNLTNIVPVIMVIV